MVASTTSLTGRSAGSGAVLRGVGTGIAGALFWCVFAVEHVVWFLRTGRVVGVGLAVTELLAASLFLVRRVPTESSARPADWAMAFAGTFGALAARPNGVHAVAGDVAGLSLQAAGLVVVLLGLAALGRSFGLVAARRGVVTGGPYRFVRHPLYAAYGLLQVGYLLQSFRLWNVGVFAIVWACQVGRIRAEERLLSSTPEYSRYMGRTRYRLVPGVW